MEKIVTIFTAIIGIAMVAVIVQSTNTSAVITASGNAFSSSVSAAMGQVGRR
jgi:hypothetical protein